MGRRGLEEGRSGFAALRSRFVNISDSAGLFIRFPGLVVPFRLGLRHRRDIMSP